MKQIHNIGYFIEDLWAQGFRLSDESIRFIYLGKQTTDVPDWKVIFALKVTIQIQFHFVGSFYLSLLELLADPEIKTEQEAAMAIQQTGLEVVS